MLHAGRWVTALTLSLLVAPAAAGAGAPADADRALLREPARAQEEIAARLEKAKTAAADFTVVETRPAALAGDRTGHATTPRRLRMALRNAQRWLDLGVLPLALDSTRRAEAEIARLQEVQK